MILLGVDTGGTFTDFVFRDGDQWGIYKVLSTPVDPAEAVSSGLGHVADGKGMKIIHGSTVATNAILERKGAKTALITNRGFKDIIEIGRQNRERLYDLAYKKAPRIVPEDLRFGVNGRILYTGEEQTPLDAGEIGKIIAHLKETGVESVAVCFLFSYANTRHERHVGEMLEAAGIRFSLSHEILSEFREYERTSTTVVNAYVSPKMQRYIGSLIKRLDHEDSLSIMQSNGGSISARTAMRESVRTILSGPAGGAVGAFEIGGTAGFSKLISFDMGGTSTDVCLLDEGLPLTMESVISGYPVKVPMIDIHTVGAGGGSIACLDVGASLNVGPESAGADPGPVCYGRGTQITVTDANLYLGRLIPEHFLNGHMKLGEERLEEFLSPMAKAAGLSVLELAEGILSVVNTAMEKAIRVISVERGHDPREFTLFSFGGAGGMHAAFLARLLNIPRVLIPRNPGILSALGMLMADVIKDYSLTVMITEGGIKNGNLPELFEGLERKGIRDLIAEGISEDRVILEKYLDMRYEGQSYEILVPFEDNPAESFHRLHEKTYGYRNRDKHIQIVNIRLRARGIPEKPVMQEAKTQETHMSHEAVLGEREVVFDQRRLAAKIIARDRLVSGNEIRGPAVVTEYSSTLVIPPFANAVVDGYGNIIMEIKT